MTPSRVGSRGERDAAAEPAAQHMYTRSLSVLTADMPAPVTLPAPWRLPAPSTASAVPANPTTHRPAASASSLPPPVVLPTPSTGLLPGGARWPALEPPAAGSLPPPVVLPAPSTLAAPAATRDEQGRPAAPASSRPPPIVLPAPAAASVPAAAAWVPAAPASSLPLPVVLPAPSAPSADTRQGCMLPAGPGLPMDSRPLPMVLPAPGAAPPGGSKGGLLPARPCALARGLPPPVVLPAPGATPVSAAGLLEVGACAGPGAPGSGLPALNAGAFAVAAAPPYGVRFLAGAVLSGGPGPAAARPSLPIMLPAPCPAPVSDVYCGPLHTAADPAPVPSPAFVRLPGAAPARAPGAAAVAVADQGLLPPRLDAAHPAAAALAAQRPEPAAGGRMMGGHPVAGRAGSLAAVPSEPWAAAGAPGCFRGTDGNLGAGNTATHLAQPAQGVGLDDAGWLPASAYAAAMGAPCLEPGAQSWELGAGAVLQAALPALATHSTGAQGNAGPNLLPLTPPAAAPPHTWPAMQAPHWAQPAGHARAVPDSSQGALAAPVQHPALPVRPLDMPLGKKARRRAAASAARAEGATGTADLSGTHAHAAPTALMGADGPVLGASGPVTVLGPHAAVPALRAAAQGAPEHGMRAAPPGSAHHAIGPHVQPEQARKRSWQTWLELDAPAAAAASAPAGAASAQAARGTGPEKRRRAPRGSGDLR